MEEIWEKIKGFENYQISNLGRVKRTSWARNSPNGKILKPSKNHSGYLTVCIRKDKKSYCKLIHRLIAEAFIDNPNNYETVDHIDGDKTNNTINNLQWMTQQDNWYKYKNSEKFKEVYQKIKQKCSNKKQRKRNERVPKKKRCYIFNNTVFFKFKDLQKYLNKNEYTTRYFCFKMNILKDFVLLLLNGKIIQIEDKTGSIRDDFDINTLKIYNYK